MISLLVIVAIIICIIRILRGAGVRFSFYGKYNFLKWKTSWVKGNKTDQKWFLCNLFDKKMNYKSYKVTKYDLYMVFYGAFMFRFIVYLLSAGIMKLYLDSGNSLSFQGFLDEWTKWDAINYLRIAEGGYEFHTETKELMENGVPVLKTRYTTLAFFPLYAWMIRGMNLWIHNRAVSALLVSSLCYAAGCVFLFSGIAKDYGKNIASKTVTYLSVFPFAFFFGAMMPESTFFLMLAAGFYFIRKHCWIGVAVIGVFACLSRMQGILLIIPACIEWVEYRRPFHLIRKKRYKFAIISVLRELCMIPLMGIGSLIYLYINKKVTGNPFAFLEYQKTVWGQEAQWFGETVEDMWRRTISGNEGTSLMAYILPQLVIAVLVVIAVYYGMGRVHDLYLVFLLVYFIMNYLPTTLLSGGRYFTVAIPFFLIIAVFVENHKWLDRWMIGLNMMLTGIYLYGYLTWRMIM